MNEPVLSKLQSIIYEGLKQVVEKARSDEDLLEIMDEVCDKIDDAFYLYEYDEGEVNGLR